MIRSNFFSLRLVFPISIGTGMMAGHRWVSARLGFDFRYNIFKWLNFTDRFVFYPTIGEGGLYFLRNEAALNIPLGEIPF